MEPYMVSKQLLTTIISGLSTECDYIDAHRDNLDFTKLIEVAELARFKKTERLFIADASGYFYKNSTHILKRIYIYPFQERKDGKAFPDQVDWLVKFIRHAIPRSR
jgi:hypothetical protein